MKATIPAKDRRWLWVGMAITVAGIGWRVAPSGDWPFQHHDMLQYESAMVARKVWLTLSPHQVTPERQVWFNAVGTSHITSPPLLPAMVALTYCATGRETPWLACIYGSAMWLVAGWLLLFAVRRMTGSTFGGVVGMAWFDLNTHGVIFSRSFQTEPVMALGFAIAIWNFSKPGRTWNWTEVINTGLLCGIVGGFKPGVVIAPLEIAFMALIFNHRPAHSSSLSKLLVFTALLLAPAAIYAAFMLRHHVSAKIQPELLTEGHFYEGWGTQIQNVVGWVSLSLGLLGAALALKSRQLLPASLFLGYLVYAGTFTYHNATHNYYQVPLILIVAVAIGYFAAALGNGLHTPHSKQLLCLAAIITFAGYLYSERGQYNIGPWQLKWQGKKHLNRFRELRSLRNEQYEAILRVVPLGSRCVTLTEWHAYDLEYRTWFPIGDEWPETLVPNASDSLVSMTRHGCRYFVITNMESYRLQPNLEAALQDLGRVILIRPDLVVFVLDSSLLK